jgi:transcriptional regulator with XRE-family HTH domain
MIQSGGLPRALRSARERSGLPIEEVALRVGVSADDLFDLESYEGDLGATISVRALIQLLKVLKIRPSECLALGSPASRRVESLREFADVLKSQVSASGQTAAGFEERIGWGFEDAINDPTAFELMNLDGFAAIAEAIEVDWVHLLERLT